MQRRLQLQALIAILSVGMMFSSCGNIDIVKRKYRPGFHVDVSKKRQKTKASESSAVADSRKAKPAKSVEPRKAEIAPQEIDDNLTASSDSKPRTDYGVKEVRDNVKKELRSPDFKGLTFDRKMDRIKREVFKPNPNAANLEWMKWVAFGTGIGSLAFGAMALIFAFLTGTPIVSYAWPFIVLGMLLGAAAIVFYILYKNQNGTDAKARLGFIFGIIGAGLSVLAIIIWAIFWAVFVI